MNRCDAKRGRVRRDRRLAAFGKRTGLPGCLGDGAESGGLAVGLAQAEWLSVEERGPGSAAQEEQYIVKNIKIEVTLEELLLVSSLLSDQLFRREFIDPKMPGYKGDPAELAMGKDLVLRLKSMAREAWGSAVVGSLRRAPSHLSSGLNGVPDAV